MKIATQNQAFFPSNILEKFEYIKAMGFDGYEIDGKLLVENLAEVKAAIKATGLPVNLFLSHEHGGIEQIGQRIIYNEIDMVLFFNSPQDHEMDQDVLYISRLCDQHSVPMATNVATAELLIHGLARGDLDWREIVNPNRVPFAL